MTSCSGLPKLEAPHCLRPCTHQLLLQHDFFNVFLGGMLGGSIVWGLRAIINEPSAQGRALWLCLSAAAALAQRLRIVMGGAYRRAWGVMPQPPALWGC